ncbi:MAG: restriction endonuclease [Bdellovibrionaceae bacterium]|nr:restriction endonuclease [Pseudobdellovibrionaceae bacterium]
MSIPDYQTVMLPLLRLAGQQSPISVRDAIEKLSVEFKLTKEERSALLPSGKQEIIVNRVGWARTYMKKAGLLTSPARGMIEITERGKQVLAEKPPLINVAFLSKFPEFEAFRSTENEKEEASIKAVITSSSIGTPEEQLEQSYQELKTAMLDDIIQRVMACSPQFFEKLVVDTVVKMGYGGSRKEAGKAIGQSGDEGIDGIINEDRLGLDVIYLQAKRWEGNVSRPEIQKFAGALQGKRARKGIFITTSDFTSEAREFVKHIDAKIILISGHQLSELMWEYNIGVSSSAAYEVKRLDLDFLQNDGDIK